MHGIFQDIIKSKTKKLESEKYVCYLSDGGSSAPSDSLLGQGRNLSTKNYYKELIEFSN